MKFFHRTFQKHHTIQKKSNTKLGFLQPLRFQLLTTLQNLHFFRFQCKLCYLVQSRQVEPRIEATGTQRLLALSRDQWQDGSLKTISVAKEESTESFARSVVLKPPRNLGTQRPLAFQLSGFFPFSYVGRNDDDDCLN